MKFLNVGALRPATDDARLSAAQDLVQNTLARHGLSSPMGHGTGINQLRARSVQGLPSDFDKSLTKSGSAAKGLPPGAEFRHDSFTNHAGGRAFRTYIPASASTGATGVVVMLHGCTQTPEDFAAGTSMNTLAEQHGFIAVYPAQSRGHNAQSCWNWFSRGDQRRGQGEPAIIAGLTKQICAEHGVPRDRTFIAGLSAGGAMAAILGEAYPDVFAGVGVHSGLPVGAAKDVPSAFAAMAGNSLELTDCAKSGDTARMIVFHGTADSTVHPSNSDKIFERFARGAACQSFETVEQGSSAGRRFIRTTLSNPDGSTRAEKWSVEGQGHAWSGGHPAGSHTDPQGPDASAEMIRFFFNFTDMEL